MPVIEFQPTRPLRGATESTHTGLVEYVFQPTRPLRGATSHDYGFRCPHWHFNPRAPCGARPQVRRPARSRRCISTHAPLAGRDAPVMARYEAAAKFQPTRPLRGATEKALDVLEAIVISTHAPLAGRDHASTVKLFSAPRFQPTRPLRGATEDITLTIPPYTFQPTRPLRGATMIVSVAPAGIRFQPTRPLRGATGYIKPLARCFCISTHAPLAGRDRCGRRHTDRRGDFNPRAPCGARPVRRGRTPPRQYFNPRAPCGARPVGVVGVHRSVSISTHAPLAGRDQLRELCGDLLLISTHAPLAGRDILRVVAWMYLFKFQPTRPLRGATRMHASSPCSRSYFNPRAPCGARLCS